MATKRNLSILIWDSSHLHMVYSPYTLSLSILIWDSSERLSIEAVAIPYERFQFSFEIHRNNAGNGSQLTYFTFNSHLRFIKMSNPELGITTDDFQFSFEIHLKAYIGVLTPSEISYLILAKIKNLSFLLSERFK